MFNKLKKYKGGHFIFDNNKSLVDVCNAPQNKSGVYIIYTIKDSLTDLVYIGSSGKIQNDGKVKHRNGGLYDRLVNGKQFGKPRKQSFIDKMIEENIYALDIYWYDTVSDKDIPATVEGVIIQKYFDANSCLPKWNKAY